MINKSGYKKTNGKKKGGNLPKKTIRRFKKKKSLTNNKEKNMCRSHTFKISKTYRCRRNIASNAIKTDATSTSDLPPTPSSAGSRSSSGRSCWSSNSGAAGSWKGWAAASGASASKRAAIGTYNPGAMGLRAVLRQKR